MIHRDEFEEMCDEHVQMDEPMFWVNPDVPGLDTIEDNDGEVTFDCPYDNCNDDFEVLIEDWDSFHEFLKDNNGTFRCAECDEPIFGLIGEGDH